MSLIDAKVVVGEIGVLPSASCFQESHNLPYDVTMHGAHAMSVLNTNEGIHSSAEVAGAAYAPVDTGNSNREHVTLL